MKFYKPLGQPTVYIKRVGVSLYVPIMWRGWAQPIDSSTLSIPNFNSILSLPTQMRDAMYNVHSNTINMASGLTVAKYIIERKTHTWGCYKIKIEDYDTVLYFTDGSEATKLLTIQYRNDYQTPYAILLEREGADSVMVNKILSFLGWYYVGHATQINDLQDAARNLGVSALQLNIPIEIPYPIDPITIFSSDEAIQAAPSLTTGAAYDLHSQFLGDALHVNSVVAQDLNDMSIFPTTQPIPPSISNLMRWH